MATLNNETIYIHSIYAPVHRADRPMFFNNLTIPPDPGSHIIGGDFNCVLNAQTDTSGDQTLATVGSTELTNWISSLNAVDAWRTQHEDIVEFTSPSGLSRIDMIFLSGCFTSNFTTTHMPRTIGSDHLCPSATISSSDISYKGGHWQLPTWLARKASRAIEPILNKLGEATDHPDYTDKFIRAMDHVTAKCKAAHKKVLRSRSNKIEMARVRWMRAHLRAINNPTDDLVSDAERARVAWIKEVEEDSERKRAWAFDKHYAEAERCTRFFLRRPKPNSTTIIAGARRTDGITYNDRANIQAAHNEYWSKLYSANARGTETPILQHNINELTNISLPRLSSTNAQSLEADITADDICRQIKRLPYRKAAGADGLRGELFRQNPSTWAKVLLPIFQKILQDTESLPKPFRESIVILLYKKGCPNLPENYRPIALVNVMAKLLSNVHSARLRRVIHSVIPKEQTGFVPGRSISENIIFLGDAIHYAKRNHPSSIILALDFAKAYDRIQWPVMFAVLRKMAFGPKFLTTIQAMYKSRTAQLSINGELTLPFPIQRGVLQGDPLSPALFILACSPLYKKLEGARDTHGIPLPNDRPAPVATYYADDTTIIARSHQSATHLYNLTEWFCTNSGAQLHRGKCVAIPTGPSPSTTLNNGIRILHPTESTTILGVPMGRSITRQQQVQSIVSKMIGKCEKWSHLGRTIEGRITIARSIILPTLWYTLAALPIDPKEAKKIQTIVNNYINRKEQTGWGGPTVRGNFTNVWYYMPKHKGGWGLAPVLRTLKCRKLSFMRRFIKERELNLVKPWHTFIMHTMREHLSGWCNDWEGMFYWKGTPRQGEFGTGNWDALSPWWRDVWGQWLQLQCEPARNSLPRLTLLRWPVWNNRILARDHGIQSTLYQSFSNNAMRAHMRSIKAVGFTKFEDFMTPYDSVMTGDDLYTAVTVSLSVHGVDNVVPRVACRSLMRNIAALWANAKQRWLLHSSITTTTNRGTKWWARANKRTAFNDANNKAITSMIEAGEPAVNTPRMIKVRNDEVVICWKRERTALAVLAPSRRDLMRRLIRNALPVGAKRVHWTTPTQTKCLLCTHDKLETVKHLLWDCCFAKETWGAITSPWRTQLNANISWKEVLTGYEVRLGITHNRLVDRMWAIVRACTMRCIWFERNRRFFTRMHHREPRVIGKIREGRTSRCTLKAGSGAPRVRKRKT